MRTKSSYFKILFSQIEYTDELFVPEDVWESRIWQQLLNLMTALALYLNDVYSFEKELKDMKSIDKMVNSVALLCHLKGITVNESMLEMAAIISKTEKKLIEIENKLLAIDDYPSDAKTFIVGMNYLISGSIVGYEKMGRYNKLD